MSQATMFYTVINYKVIMYIKIIVRNIKKGRIFVNHNQSSFSYYTTTSSHPIQDDAVKRVLQDNQTFTERSVQFRLANNSKANNNGCITDGSLDLEHNKQTAIKVSKVLIKRKMEYFCQHLWLSHINNDGEGTHLYKGRDKGKCPTFEQLFAALVRDMVKITKSTVCLRSVASWKQ